MNDALELIQSDDIKEKIIYAIRMSIGNSMYTQMRHAYGIRLHYDTRIDDFDVVYHQAHTLRPPSKEYIQFWLDSSAGCGVFAITQIEFDSDDGPTDEVCERIYDAIVKKIKIKML